MTPEPIRTVAAVICDTAGRVLLVRKRGTAIHIQPGGKREPGEAPLTTLARELREELGVTLRPGSAVHLGEFEGQAANEPGRRVRAEVYRVEIEGEPVACAEIEALAWVEPATADTLAIAPLSAMQILPRVWESDPAMPEI